MLLYLKFEFALIPQLQNVHRAILEDENKVAQVKNIFVVPDFKSIMVPLLNKNFKDYKTIISISLFSRQCQFLKSFRMGLRWSIVRIVGIGSMSFNREMTRIVFKVKDNIVYAYFRWIIVSLSDYRFIKSHVNSFPEGGMIILYTHLRNVNFNIKPEPFIQGAWAHLGKVANNIMSQHKDQSLSRNGRSSFSNPPLQTTLKNTFNLCLDGPFLGHPEPVNADAPPHYLGMSP